MTHTAAVGVTKDGLEHVRVLAGCRQEEDEMQLRGDRLLVACRTADLATVRDLAPVLNSRCRLPGS